MNKNLPQTIDQLRGLIIEMKADANAYRLGKRSRQVLAGLVDAPDQAAVHTISELSETIGVSASTLTRLAQKLGYKGFGELQDIFRRHVTGGKSHFYSDHAGRLLKKDQNGQDSLALITTVAEEETSNIDVMLKGVDVRALEQTAKLLATAPRIRTHGLRQFYAIACFYSYALGMLRGEVSVLGDSQHGVAHGLAQLEAGDVLLVVGAYPYTRGTAAAARIAAAHGMPIIAITDSSASPLAASATYTFIAPTGGTFYSNSMASFLVFAEGLLTLVAQKLGDHALDALKHRESFIGELNIEL